MWTARSRLRRIESVRCQIDISPETERLVREEINSRHFRSVDDVIKAGVEALRAGNTPRLSFSSSASPLVGLEFRFERDQDIARDITL